MQEIKIKLWGLVWLNKKQFIIVYAVMCLIFLILMVYFWIFPITSKAGISGFEKFLTEYFSFFWLTMLLSAILEGQFYWIKFVKKQLSIIEEQNQKLKHQKDEIKTQRDEIEQQRDYVTVQRNEIAAKNKTITDSINYAKRIQTAVLSQEEILKDFFQEFFIYYKPRDIVSGDFFWFHSFENKIIVAAADCTGHGIPGAFMSMLGISFLNEIIKNFIDVEKISSNEILDKLREEVKISLHQTGKNEEAKDGMDIALMILDKKKNKIQFSGAHNPLYIFRNNELIEIKADKQPIGIFLREKPFSAHEIEIQKDDVFYMFSDGYQDQFGGEKNDKYKSRRLKNLFSEINNLEMEKQKLDINNNFENWKKDNDQVDDILILGLKY